jgi:hypothetical protein
MFKSKNRKVIKSMIFIVITLVFFCLLYIFVFEDRSSAISVSIDELWEDRDGMRQFSGRLVTISGQISWISPLEGVVCLYNKNWRRGVPIFLAGTDSGVEKRVKEIEDLHILNLSVRGTVEYDKRYDVQIINAIMVFPCPVLWALDETLPTMTVIATALSGALVVIFFTKFRTTGRVKKGKARINMHWRIRTQEKVEIRVCVSCLRGPS